MRRSTREILLDFGMLALIQIPMFVGWVVFYINLRVIPLSVLAVLMFVVAPIVAYALKSLRAVIAHKPIPRLLTPEIAVSLMLAVFPVCIYLTFFVVCEPGFSRRLTILPSPNRADHEPLPRSRGPR